MSQVAYKVGEIYLCSICTEKLFEAEILDISQDSRAIKTSLDNWQTAESFHRTVKGKLGYAVYSNFLGFKTRKVIRTN